MTNEKVGPGDLSILRAALGEEETETSGLTELAKAATLVHDTARKHLDAFIDEGKARYVRRLRVDDSYSWRAVAMACYYAWEGAGWRSWAPPDNQLIGMAICESAAAQLGEDAYETPWN